jgi:hypothetical protein
MKLTGENRSPRVKTCPSATLSTTNPTWTFTVVTPIVLDCMQPVEVRIR